MITLEDYFNGRDKEYASELTDEIKTNASILLTKVNHLLDELSIGGVKVNSGWRPPSVNQAIGGAKLSNHMTGHAIDISDKFHYLCNSIIQDIEILITTGLYMEDPENTKSWCHLQDIETHSGKRIFLP